MPCACNRLGTPRRLPDAPPEQHLSVPPLGTALPQSVAVPPNAGVSLHALHSWIRHMNATFGSIIR